MSTATDSNLLHVAIWLLFAWFLLFHCWKNHRVDSFRQRLFAIRDELFDYAAAGHISFDHPAYGTLRTLLNRSIRFAHKLRFSEALLIVLAERVWPNPHASHELLRILQPILSLPDGDVKGRLLAWQSQILLEVVRFLFTGSPLFFFFAVIFGAVSLLRGAVRSVSDLLSALATGVPGIDSLQVLAFESEAQ